MKLAIIDPGGSPGGVSRLIRSFLPAIRQVRPDWKITFLGNPESFERDGLQEICQLSNIEVKALSSLRLSQTKFLNLSEVGKFIGYLQQRYSQKLSWLPPFFSGAVHREIEKKIQGFDLAFFPWIYRFKCPRLECPIVGLMHDFNYKYHFCAKGFHPWSREYLEKEIPLWMKQITPVVTSYFIHSEMQKFFPEAAAKTEVIHLAPLSIPTLLLEKQAKKMVQEIGIQRDYILYPSSTAGPHKNLGSLLAAMAILKQRGHSIVLILTGNDTGHIRGKACLEGVELNNMQDPDIQGLGYVSHEQMDALIQCAKAVVCPSLYEAGNGPGLDAWIRGVPVAMSDISSFKEHLTVLGVRAALFNPRFPKDIADKIEEILLDPKRAKEDALISYNALSKISWKDTIIQYVNLFEKLTTKKPIK